MINNIDKIKTCDNCKNKTQVYELRLNRKIFNLCDKCLSSLYKEIGHILIPKSPVSILKKDNRIKIDRFKF